MFADNVHNLAACEKVVHIAYDCSCVRTFHVEREVPAHVCPKHGKGQITFTVEYLKPKAA